MSVREVGSYIGYNRVTSTSQNSASGIWSLAAAERRVRSNSWPTYIAPDPSFSSVELLLHMDGVNGSTTFTDSSSNALTVTASGGAAISTTQSKFGGASGYFDGNGDYLSINNAAIAIGTGDFTAEAWFRLNSGNNTFRHVFDTRTTDATGFALGVDGQNRVFLFSVNTFRVEAGSVSPNTWYHIALSRNSGNVRVFLDGTQVGTTWVDSTNYSQQLLWVGKYFDTTQYYWTGYLDEVRWTVGVGRYTANFTPPTAAFPDA